MAGWARVESRAYRLLHPRPVYVIVARAGERVNAMAASWVSPFSEDPPRIMAAFEKESYTYSLVRESGVFTVNVVDDSLAELVWCVGTRSGREVDKVRECGLELEESPGGFPAPHLAGALGFIEARVHRIYTDLAEDVDLVVADVVAAYAKSGAYNPRYGWELQKARVLMHASGRAFTVPGRLVVVRGRG